MVALVEHVERGAFYALAILLLVTIEAASGQRTEIIQVSPNDNDIRTFRCRFTDITNQRTWLSGAVFYLNGTDVRTNLTNREYRVEDGVITLTMRQELEGDYTCYEGGSCPGICQPLVVVATPSANNSIPLYYLKKVGESVTMICGTRQGLLASRYTAEWLIYQTINVEYNDSYRERVGVIREELKDYSLTLSPLRLTDSTEYQCRVKIEIVEGDPHYVRNPAITLQVYQEPVINFLSSNQTHSVNGSQSLSISFICNATGSPNLHINWIHNGIPIPSDSLDFTSTSHSIGNNGRLSELQVTPHLRNSGEITCEASINYHTPVNKTKGDLITKAEKISRSLFILDSSLSPVPFPTTDNDLLVRIEITGGIKLPANTKMKLKATPRDSNDEKPIEISISDVIFDSSLVYGFVPASQTKFKKFSVQISIIVNQVTGPYSPEDENITAAHLVDFDSVGAEECSENLHIFLPSVLAALVAITITILVGFISCLVYRFRTKRDRLISCEDIYENLEREIKEERDRNPPRQEQIVVLYGTVQCIINTRKRMQGGKLTEDGKEDGTQSATGEGNDEVSEEETKRRKESLQKLLNQLEAAYK